MLRAWVLLLSVSGCASVPLPMSVVLPQSVAAADPTIRWYDIEGGSAAAIRAQLDRLGPLDADGYRHDAYTEWFVTWHFPFVEAADGCAVGMVETVLRVTVTLPRWAASAETNEALVEQWRSYIDALWQHEGGHRETGVRAAAEIAQRLPGLPKHASCADAETAANVAAKALLQQHREADRSYDAETRHGAAQGAVFP